MKFTAVLLLSLIALATAAPILSNVDNRIPISESGEIIPGSYIISFRKGVDITKAQALATSVNAKHFYHIENADAPFIGMAGEFSDNIVESLRFRSDLIEVIERNAIARTSARQNNPPSWGLGASSHTSAVNPGYYDYPDHSGVGVTIYIIDTGIRCTHNDFGGRCVFGARFGQGGQDDGNGHGTHCAGTAAGTQYGIAKSASLVAVGVLGPTGSGAWDDVISGINWAASDCNARGTHCVGSMSLGGGATTTVDNAANAFVTATRFMSVAAGNNNGNAANYSPARAADVFTVMAHEQFNGAARKASYSNYGTACQLWAAGSSITSAWSTSDTATNTISGTSMACPHVSGAAALAFTSGLGSTDRFAIENYINQQSTPNAISGVPAGTSTNALHVDTVF